MIRFIFSVLFIVSFLIFSIPLVLMELVLGGFSKEAKAISSLAIVNWAFRVVLFITGVNLTVIGEENVPKDQAVLYVGNHTSFFDVVLTYVRVPRPTGYISKKEFEKIPLLSTWMKFLYCQFLDRKDIKSGMRMILKCIELIKNGISICVFPEGTRNRNPDTMLPFHSGSFKIAKKANCPIVPMTLTNSSAIFEKQYPRMKKAHVILEYGKPYYLDDLDMEDQKHIGDYVQNQLQATYNKNKKLI